MDCPFVCVDFRNSNVTYRRNLKRAPISVFNLSLAQHVSVPIRLKRRMAAAVADIKQSGGTPFPATSAITT